jgi:hypothetical protein
MRRISNYARHNLIAFLALFFALGGGAAWAANTIGSADIIDGQVKTADIGDNEVKEADVGQGAVASPELKNDSIAAGDVAPNSLTTSRIADGSLTGTDVANSSLTGTDIDESTLDVGDAARAYARVAPALCAGTPGTCTPEQSKGITAVSRDATGEYCVIAPGIDSTQAPAAVTVDWQGSAAPEGNASAMTREVVGCGASGQGFRVITERQPNVTVDAAGGTNNATAVGPAAPADDVGFTIVIP